MTDKIYFWINKNVNGIIVQIPIVGPYFSTTGIIRPIVKPVVELELVKVETELYDLLSYVYQGAELDTKRFTYLAACTALKVRKYYKNKITVSEAEKIAIGAIRIY